MPLSHQIQGASTGLGSNNNKHTGGRSFIILSLLSIVLLTVSARMGTEGPLEMVRGGFSTITMPFRMAGFAIVSPFLRICYIFYCLLYTPCASDEFDGADSWGLPIP